MNGLDSFFGADAAEGASSPDKVREYKARMARNQQLMAAAQKQEQKQKKDESKLVAILLKFIHAHKRSDVTLLITRCLEQNIPAVFILAIILLGNEEIQEETGIKLQLVGGEELGVNEWQELEDKEMKGALVVFERNHAFPLKIRMTIDLWGKNIFEAASPIPERILKTVVEYNEDPRALLQAKEVVTQLTAFILRDYLAEFNFSQTYENLKSFADFFMKGVLKRVKDQIEGQRQLGKGE